MERTIVKIEDDRTGLEIDTLKRAILDNLFFLQGKFPEVATDNDWFMAVAYTVRDRLLHRWISTWQQIMTSSNTKVVGYLSAEYLMGPHLVNNAVNMGILDRLQVAVQELGLDFQRSSSRKKNRDWATAVWAGWRRASSIRCRRWKCLLSATASGTNSASSIR